MVYSLALLLCFTTLVAGVVPFFIPKKNIHFSSLLTFSGSYLFSIVLLHMVPELFEGHAHVADGRIWFSPGFYLLMGFLLQLLLDLLGANVTHGHGPQHITEHNKGCVPEITPLYSLVPALLLHSLLESFLLTETDMGTFFAVLLHKMPAAFTLTTILRHRGYRKRKIMVILALFSSVTPIGFLLHEGFSHVWLLTPLHEMWLSAIATGSLFHVAATILFESNPDHQLRRSKWVAIFAGVLLAVLGEAWFHAH